MVHWVHGQLRTVHCYCILLTLFPFFSSIGPLPGLWSFGINVLQHGSTKGCSSHQNLLQWDSHRLHGYSCLHRQQCEFCSTMTFSIGYRDTLPHHHLHQGLQGNLQGLELLLFSFSAELFVSLVFLIPRAAVWHFVPSYTLFPRSATTLAGAQPSLMWVGWSCLELLGSGCPSHGPSTAPFATSTQGIALKSNAAFQTVVNQSFLSPMGLVSLRTALKEHRPPEVLY